MVLGDPLMSHLLEELFHVREFEEPPTPQLMSSMRGNSMPYSMRSTWVILVFNSESYRILSVCLGVCVCA